MRRTWFTACGAILFSVAASAHQDPVGDVHPIVVVESGNFAVYFRNNSVGDGYTENTRPVFRALYRPDGRLLAPRHPVKGLPEISSPVEMDRFHDRKPNATLTLPEGKQRVLALAWPKDVNVRMLESAALSPDHIATALKTENDREKFFVYLFPRKGFVEPERFLIGVPEMIYDFPTTSNVVFANGKFWIAWVRGHDMVISSLKPGGGKPVERVLDTPADWNSNLSLAVIGDRICLAYHCSVTHQYPGTSEIITTFIEAE